MTPRFSIIIPHYNTPDLLMRCLDSIPVSEDIQVIVVDDYSPDADSFLQRYPQLSRPYLDFVRTSRNGGAGYARNVGLEHTKGKWLLFADADDFFVDGMYDIISSYEESDVDVIYFRKKSICSDVDPEVSKLDDYLDEIIDVYLQTGDEWPLRTRHYVPWGKMIRRELLVRHDIRFDEIKYSDDCFFSVSVGFHAKKITVADQVLYCYFHHPNSLTYAYCSKPGELKTRADVFFRIDRFLLQHDMCRERALTDYLIKMLKEDRSLYSFYFNNRLDELYPSRFAAIKDICRGHSLVAQAFIFLYSLLIWKRHPSVS